MFYRFLSPLFWIASIFVILFVYTKIIGPIPFSVNSVVTQKTTTFDVTAEGKVSAKPDTAFVNAGIQATSSTVKGVQDQINEVINKISQVLKQDGIDAKDIQTTNYNINPVYDYLTGTQKITGYSASANLFIKVKNIDKINEVIDIAVKNGANQISGLNFDVDDKSKLEETARQIAVNKARKKADNAARIAGFRLGRIVNYNENFNGQPRPVPMLAGMAKTFESIDTKVEPGSADITISVTLSYEIQ